MIFTEGAAVAVMQGLRPLTLKLYYENIMKKLIMFVFIFCIVSVLEVSAQQIVSSYSELQSIYQSTGSKTITLGNNIIFADNLFGDMGGNLNINGNDRYLDLSGYEGFRLSAGQILTLGNIYEIRGSSCAIYVSSANVNILNGISFSSNMADNGGAIYNTDYSTMTFRNGNIVFSGNASRAPGSGGAIYNNGSRINFEMSSGDTIVFSNNTANNGGGAIYSSSNPGNNTNVSNAIITFQNGYIIFIENSANNGGAIYNSSRSQINFEMSSGYTIIFSSNTALNSGGAIENNTGRAFFRNTDVMFSGNSAGWSGGAIINSYGGTYFSSSTVSFINNSASYYGGAIYSDSYSRMEFEMSSENIITFNGNTANLGGAIYSGHANFSGGRVVFEENIATDKGGAWYTIGNIVGFPTAFTNTDVMFIRNSASSGGAIYTSASSNIDFSGKLVIFEGNTANDKGGALCITGSTVSFNTNGGEVLFIGNKANGKPNDVYMDTNAILNISGTNTIRFEGGILSVSSAEINKSGRGAMYLGGTNEIWGDFNITGTEIIMMADATYEGKELLLGNTNKLDMHNGTMNTVNVTGKFESKNNLKMDIFYDKSSDKITANTAEIGGNIDIFAEVGTYNNEEFELIITNWSLNGEFASSTINDNALTYELKYRDGIVKLIVDGMSVTNFVALSPLSLTYNQNEASKALDKISKNPEAWRTMLTRMRDKHNSGTEDEIAEVKNFLTQTSGYFLVNVIRNMAADSPNNEVYDKIRNHIEEHETNNGLWMQLKGGVERFKSDENSPENYRDVSMGVMFGLDRFLAGKFARGDAMWGVYARINKDNIDQGKHKAAGNKNGLGVYGGLIKNDWEFKAVLLGSYDKFSAERMTYGGNIAKADINGVTVSVDIEAAFKIRLNENVKLKPYAGIEAANSMYGSFKERGAGIYNLDVNSGNYFRSAARIGAGVDCEKGRWILYSNVEGKYKVAGTKPEIDAVFENTGVKFSSRGSEEGKMEAGIGAGAETEIAQNWKIFINGKYYAGERYENLYGNTGVRYIFGSKKRLYLEEAKKKFNKAKKLYNKGEYLRATDMLSEITVSYPNYKPPMSLYIKIQDDMDKTATSREEPDFSKLTYAKGYCAYYKAEYNDALNEWTKYIQFVGRNYEITEYMNKINSMLKLKDFISRESELDAKANEMLDAGIAKYEASKWILCIKDMEALQKFVTENKFSGTDEYYNKAKEYIDLSVKELTKKVKATKKETKPKEPETKAENKPEIDEIEAEKKYNEGLMLYAQGKYLEAERTWELTLRLNPNHQKAKIALSRLRSSGQLTE